MKRYDNIMQDNVQAPKTENNIWLKDNMLYYYVNGKWQLIGGASEEDRNLLYNLKQEVEDLIGLSTSDAIDNLNEIKKFLEGFKDDEELKEWMNNYYTKDEINDIVKKNTPDWDANEGESGYIKNKPLIDYEEGSYETIVDVEDIGFRQIGGPSAPYWSYSINEPLFETLDDFPTSDCILKINGEETILHPIGYKLVDAGDGTMSDVSSGYHSDTTIRLDIAPLGDYGSAPFGIGIHIFPESKYHTSEYSSNVHLELLTPSLKSVKKLDPNLLIISQKTGDSETVIMSQKAVTETIKESTAGCEATEKRVEEIEKDLYGDPTNGYEYVDMGEAGIWAKYPIGITEWNSDSLNQIKYFAWGETAGYTKSQVGIDKQFNWSDYKYGDGETQLTKYCDNSNYGKDGFVDNLTTLLPEDDTCVQNMGGCWRMPTIEEFQTLYNLCNTEWVTNYNGVSGLKGALFKLKADESKQLFFPVSGYCEDGSIKYVETGGNFQSSSLHDFYPYRESCLGLFSGSAYTDGNNTRYSGCPIVGILETSGNKSEKYLSKKEASETYATKEELDKIPTLQDGVKGAENNYIYSDPTKAGKGAIAAARYRANDKGKLTAQYKYWGDSDFNYNTEFPQATPTTDGVMSAEDKKALDKINNDFDTLEFTVGTLNEGLGHANNDITKLGERITTLDDELANAVIGEEVIDEDVFPDIDKYTKEELAEELASVSPTIQDIKHNYARKDGAYEGMLVGTALNLQGQDESVNSSMYRTAGGTADIASGLAEVVGIRGESVAWNQLTTDANTTQTSGNIYSIKKIGYNVYLTKTEEQTGSGTVRAVNIHLATLISGHKYLARCNKTIINDTESTTTYVNWNAYSSESNQNSAVYYNELKPFLFSAQSNAILYFTVRVAANTIIDRAYEGINVFDLTLIYGAGNEPSTPEQFEADYQRWFGKPLTYEEYDEGSIRNVKAEGIKTVGFNLYEGKDFEGILAQWHASGNNILWRNDCGYKGQIYVQAIASGNVATNVPFKGLSREGKIVDLIKGTFGSGNIYIVIQYTDGTSQSVSARGTIDNSSTSIPITVKDICINFSWSGKRDGEYEPHWEETKSLPITSLKGKLNGEGQEVVIFPDGMKKAGNIYDEIKVEGGVVKAIKRVGSVDLGTLNWRLSTVQNTEGNFMTVDTIKGIPISAASWSLIQRLCPKYTNSKAQPADKEIGILNGFVWITDLNYTSVASFKTAMQGVILYYELKTPEEYIIDNFELPLVYKVDDFGTEQVISPENTIAPSLIVKYGMNAVDTLRRLPQNYISVESMDNFLSRLSAAMNGTWTKVWNESTGRYDFSFVANIQNDIE